MASESILELDTLLAPISDDQPTGIDLREDGSPTSPYYTIKDARNAARAAERNALFDEGDNSALEHWRTVLEKGPQILREQAKDLEIATWTVEALARKHGYAGLRDGFHLITGLVDSFWDSLYPMPDEDGLETRVASITGLNGEGAEGVLIAPIRNIQITEGQSVGPFTYWQYQQARDTAKLADEEARSQRRASLGFDLDDIQKAVAETSPQFFADLRDDIEGALASFRELGKKLDERCGAHDAPPTSNITGVLEDVLGAVNHLAQDKLPSADDTVEMPVEAETGGEAVATASINAAEAKKARNRDDAFKQLVEISEFFRKTEPHSPLSYMLEKAVRWGRMSLPELMQELIPDSSARDYYSSLTGVKTEDEYS